MAKTFTDVQIAKQGRNISNWKQKAPEIGL